ncbi:MAG: V-type ATP synthase subunit D [Victivallales bacterium]|nr:V-type ATP synthase subunit D [Victivallales bacterium]
MPKIKLTKNELKIQRDALKMYQRYLPTLQLKKQQLQLEVRKMREQAASVIRAISSAAKSWNDVYPLLSGSDAEGLESLLEIKEWRVGRRNVAGIDVPVFEELLFEAPAYDMYLTPVWFDDVSEMLRSQIVLKLKNKLMEEALSLLEQELRVVTQRVNLFEKVKIPEAKENIRKINISIGDQQTNSVGRSKIAKGKCAARDAAAFGGGEDL